MDRAYEGNETRQLALALGFMPVVPPLSARVHPWAYDREMCQRRNEMSERLFRRLMGHVALGGTKVRANASKHKAMSYKRMKEKEAQLAAASPARAWRWRSCCGGPRRRMRRKTAGTARTSTSGDGRRGPGPAAPRRQPAQPDRHAAGRGAAVAWTPMSCLMSWPFGKDGCGLSAPPPATSCGLLPAAGSGQGGGGDGPKHGGVGSRGSGVR